MAIAYTEEEERMRNMIMIRGSYMKHRPIPYNTQGKENRLPIPDLAFEKKKMKYKKEKKDPTLN